MYDIIYIGGGLNYAGAIVAAKNGKKVLLIERDLEQLGGVCLHKGCIPSKMFLHYASLIYESHHEILQGELKLSQQTLLEKKNTLLQKVTQVVTKQCAHFKLIEGDAKVIAPYKVAVNGEVFEGEHIVIGTGSFAYIPEGIAYNRKDIITSDEVLMLQSLPKKIAIYGAGAIGLEMASFFAASGSEVVLITKGDKILPKTHPDIQTAVAKQLANIEVNILYEHHIMVATSTKRGVHIQFENSESRYFPMLLIATSRVPNCDVISCEEIQVDKGIVTDDFFETSLKNHYAIGDCNAKLQLAHAARAEVLNVTERILGKTPKILNLENIVKFIHTLPMSYATVGKTKYILEQEEIPFKESMVRLNQFTYSMYNHANHGVMISYVDSENFIIGAEILAPNAEELIATVAMALAGEMDVATAQKTVLAHPTFSEALERTFYKL